MEFYGSRYAPKRYRSEPVIVSTEFYDYTGENDCDSSGAGSSTNYRVMPITYDDCTPAYNSAAINGADDCYNIQNYGSNVVLPFQACIEIYNNKLPKHVHYGGQQHIPPPPHPHQQHGMYPQQPYPAQQPQQPPNQFMVDAAGRRTPMNGVSAAQNPDYSSGGEDEIIINVRQVPMHCGCCRGQNGGYPAGQPIQQQYRVDRPGRYDFRGGEKPVKFFRCPMPCCSSMRSPVAAAAPPRYRRSATRNILHDPYSIGDLSSLYRSSCYTTHRRPPSFYNGAPANAGSVGVAGAGGGGGGVVSPPPQVMSPIPAKCRPQLIAEFVDIIDQCGPRRLYSKRYCYPSSSSSRFNSSKSSNNHHYHRDRASPRDSDYYLQDLFRNSKYYSRSASPQDEEESYYKYETRDRGGERGERERTAVYMSRREVRLPSSHRPTERNSEKRRAKYYDDHAGGQDQDSNSMEKSATEDSRVYFNKSYDRHHVGAKKADVEQPSPRSSRQSIVVDQQERDSRSTRSHRK